MSELIQEIVEFAPGGKNSGDPLIKINKMIKDGRDINEIIPVEYDGWGVRKHHETVLNVACELGHYNIVDALIDNGADVNIITPKPDGETPLKMAVEYGHIEIVKLLIEKGSDPRIKDNYGNSLLYYALKTFDVEEKNLDNIPEIIEILIDSELGKSDINGEEVQKAIAEVEAFGDDEYSHFSGQTQATIMSILKSELDATKTRKARGAVSFKRKKIKLNKKKKISKKKISKRKSGSKKKKSKRKSNRR